MKLFQINVTANCGSTGRIAEQIGQLVIKEGGESVIAYGREGRFSSSKLIRIGTTFDLFLHVLGTRIFDYHGLLSKHATLKLIRQIEKFNPDVIHLHNIHGYYLNYPILFDYLSKSSVPVVWTLHDCWAFTGHCAYFDYINCHKWKIKCFDCSGIKAYPKAFTDNSAHNFLLKKKYFTKKNNLILVPVSFWLLNLLKDSFLKNVYATVIHNGVDINVFNLKKCDTNRKIILGVANVWEPRKGLRDFYELRKLLDAEYLIILVGLKKEQVAALPKGVVGIVRTNSQNELAKLYTESLVFFNPTYEDNFPTTNLEALACGTPVITYRTGGSPEAIDGNTGFVAEKGDLKTVLVHIETIRNRGKNFYSIACRQRAVDYFDKNKQFMEYLKLYKKILSNKNIY